MVTLLKFLVGPEIIWILVCVWTSTFKKANMLKEGIYNQAIDSYATYIPALLLLLTLGLFALPFVTKKWLLLRILLVAFIGTHFLLSNVLNAHTVGGPGVGTIYIVGYILLIIAIPVAILVKYLVFK